MTSEVQKSATVLRCRDVQARIGLSKSAIYDRLSAKSPRHDPSFPRPFHLGGGRAAGWLASEIDAWIATQAGRRATP